MNDKLLRAFIDASGFEIEEVETEKKFYSQQWFNADGSLMDGAVPMGTGPIIDYKVTKKDERVNLSTHTGNKEQKSEESTEAYTLLERVMSQSEGGYTLFTDSLASEMNIFLLDN